MVPTATFPPDLDGDEDRALALVMGRLEREAPPALLRARILGFGGVPQAEAGPRRAGWGARGLAVAAAIVLGGGVQIFSRAAGSAVDREPVPSVKLAVVEDPGLPFFTALEPGGWLELDDEGMANAGR